MKIVTACGPAGAGLTNFAGAGPKNSAGVGPRPPRGPVGVCWGLPLVARGQDDLVDINICAFGVEKTSLD